MNLVSIITPSYNSELYISNTIDAILEQSYENWELLITDDCSTDRTTEIINNYIKRDNRIRLYVLNKNQGAGVARNNSIKNAKGRFIAFCDSDDRWLPNKLEIQLKYLINQKAGFTYSSYFIKDENGNSLGKMNSPATISYNKILKNNYIGCLTAIYDTKILGKMYMPEIRKRQDWVLWITIIKKLGRVHGTSKALAVYTVRSSSISRNKLNLIKYNWSVYYKALNFSLMKSIFYMIQFIYFYARKKTSY